MTSLNGTEDPSLSAATLVEEQPSSAVHEHEEPVPTGRASIPTCEVCSEQPSKYCCPGCQRRTCSLPCSKRHKEESGCTGKRDRLAFVPLQQLNDSHLLSDFRLLEEIQRVDDVARRCRPPRANPVLPPHLQTLVYQANRRNTRLLIMPPGLHKRKINTTRYDNHVRKLLWRVEWSFQQGGGHADGCVGTLVEGGGGGGDGGDVSAEEQLLAAAADAMDLGALDRAEPSGGTAPSHEAGPSAAEEEEQPDPSPPLECSNALCPASTADAEAVAASACDASQSTSTAAAAAAEPAEVAAAAAAAAAAVSTAAAEPGETASAALVAPAHPDSAAAEAEANHHQGPPRMSAASADACPASNDAPGAVSPAAADTAALDGDACSSPPADGDPAPAALPSCSVDMDAVEDGGAAAAVTAASCPAGGPTSVALAALAEAEAGGVPLSTPSTSTVALLVVDDKLDETLKLRDVLLAHLTVQAGGAAKAFALRDFAEAGVDNLRLFMRRERTPANQRCYYRFDLTRNLSSQLAFKTVVEYPTLIVCTAADAHLYPLPPSAPPGGRWAPPPPPPPGSRPAGLANEPCLPQQQQEDRPYSNGPGGFVRGRGRGVVRGRSSSFGAGGGSSFGGRGAGGSSSFGGSSRGGGRGAPVRGRGGDRGGRGAPRGAGGGRGAPRGAGRFGADRPRGGRGAPSSSSGRGGRGPPLPRSSFGAPSRPAAAAPAAAGGTAAPASTAPSAPKIMGPMGTSVPRIMGPGGPAPQRAVAAPAAAPAGVAAPAAAAAPGAGGRIMRPGAPRQMYAHAPAPAAAPSQWYAHAGAPPPQAMAWPPAAPYTVGGPAPPQAPYPAPKRQRTGDANEIHLDL